jgi:hypothetical protein
MSAHQWGEVGRACDLCAVFGDEPGANKPCPESPDGHVWDALPRVCDQCYVAEDDLAADRPCPGA